MYYFIQLLNGENDYLLNAVQHRMSEMTNPKNILISISCQKFFRLPNLEIVLYIISLYPADLRVVLIIGHLLQVICHK